VAERSGHSANALIVQGDAGVESSVRAAVAKTEERFGAVSVLVNNVGIEFNGTVLEQSREEWDRHVAVNLDQRLSFFRNSLFPECEPMAAVPSSTFLRYMHLCRGRAVPPTMRPRPGCSVSRVRWQSITGPEGIRVNAICPGYIRTPLLERWFAAIKDGEQEVARAHPLRRIGEPVDVANAVYFLASEQASFITGTVLTVGRRDDGGRTIAGIGFDVGNVGTKLHSVRFPLRR